MMHMVKEWMYTITWSPHHHHRRRRPNALWDVICSVECVCVFLWMCMSLCPVSCTPVVYGATFMNAQNECRRANGQNERTYQNKRFKCTFPYECVCIWHRRNSKQKIFRCVGLFWCAGTLCLMYLFVVIVCLFVC